VDSECDLADEAGGDSRVRNGIRRIRDRLLAEHLGLDAAAVAHGIEGATSLRAFIDSRESAADHTLVRIELPAETGAPPSEALRAAADPDGPLLSGSLLADVVPPVNAVKGRRPHVITLLANLVLFLPTWVAIAAGMVLGALRGGLVALLGSLAVAAAGYVAGRAIGPARLPRWMSRRAYRSARQLGAQGVVGVVGLRLASVASAGSIHLLCGAARIPFWTYMAGTLIGLAPPVFALGAVGALLRYTLLYPTVSNVLLTVGAALIFVVLALLVRAFVLIRRLAPSVSSHRTRAEFG
jgi:phospholipase D1/2